MDSTCYTSNIRQVQVLLKNYLLSLEPILSLLIKLPQLQQDLLASLNGQLACKVELLQLLPPIESEAADSN